MDCTQPRYDDAGTVGTARNRLLFHWETAYAGRGLGPLDSNEWSRVTGDRSDSGRVHRRKNRSRSNRHSMWLTRIGCPTARVTVYSPPGIGVTFVIWSILTSAPRPKRTNFA